MLNEDVKRRLVEAAKQFGHGSAINGAGLPPHAAQFAAAVDDIGADINGARRIGAGTSFLPLPTGTEERQDVRLPGRGRSITAFAKDVGKIVGRMAAMFRRHSDGAVMHIDPISRFVAVGPDAMRTAVEKQVNTVTIKRVGSGEDAEWVPETATMSKDTAKAVMVCDDFVRELPVVVSTSKIHTPHAGRLHLELRAPGYYPDTGLLVMPGALGPYDDVTLEQAKEVLAKFFADFPFGDDGRSLAVHLAAMLTIFCRQMLPAEARAPIFVYTANSPRVGKTLLVKTAIAPRFETATVETISKDPEELRKVLDAAALASRPYLVLDNVKHRIDVAALEAFVTASSWGGRTLGKTESFEAPHATAVFVTANAATVSTDLSNRGLFVNLWIPEADPQSRPTPKTTYDDAYLARPDVRRMLLSAMWSVVRHWHAAGRPCATGRLAGFEAWGAMIGGMVQAAGYGTPLAPPDNLDVDPDPVAAGVRELVARLADRRPLDERGFEFGEILAVCRDFDLLDVPTPKDGEAVDPRTRARMGKLLESYNGREFAMADGRRIRLGRRGNKNARRWPVQVLANGGKVE